MEPPPVGCPDPGSGEAEVGVEDVLSVKLDEADDAWVS